MNDDLTLEEAAKDAGLSRATLRQYVLDDGPEPHLDSYKRGNMRFVKPDVWESWKAAYAAAPKLGRRGTGEVRRKTRRRKDNPS